jgi:putative endonuclease
MFFVYILESTMNGRWYIGSTSDIKKRLEKHNQGGVKSTKPYKPYKLIYKEEHDSKEKAVKREYQIKRSGIIRKTIKNQIKKYGPIV